ncbi:MAG: hypothetical protein ACI308_05510 [Muribaculaceae bacterium]
MEQGKFYKQAKEIADKYNFDRVIYAGIENDCEYYMLNRAYKKGHYFGRPCVIKYTQIGNMMDVEDISEEGRAIYRLNKLHKST